MSQRSLNIGHESWPLNRVFTISRGSKTSAEVLVVKIQDGEHVGYGECVPYARYGESVDSVSALIEQQRAAIEAGMTREALQSALPSGAARNALDCALWDLERQLCGVSVWVLAERERASNAIITAETVSIDAPEQMGSAAAVAAAQGAPLLKIKLNDECVIERVRAVHEAAPEAQLIIDANEAWSLDSLQRYAPELQRLGVAMIEQPLPAGQDQNLRQSDIPIILCADESCHDSSSVEGLVGRYGMVNIKLDKTGGLTEALKLEAAARAAGLQIMMGCMVGTSLSMAPGMVVASEAQFVDLDAPLWLAADRTTPAPLSFTKGVIGVPQSGGWGGL